jgi:hypothetical protein
MAEEQTAIVYDEPVHPASIYTEKLGMEICDAIAEGRKMVDICLSQGMPAKHVIRKWVFDGKHEAFAEQYFRAKRAAAEMYVEEILDIADESSGDIYIDPDTKKVRFDGENVARSRLRIDSRKWLASKLLRSIYGEGHANQIGDSDAKPVEVARRMGDWNDIRLKMNRLNNLSGQKEEEQGEGK